MSRKKYSKMRQVIIQYNCGKARTVHIYCNAGIYTRDKGMIADVQVFQ